jgi:hypothetical protein
MLSNIKNSLETHMNEVLISIEQYKALFDIIFSYAFVTSKNEFASLLIEFYHNIFIILFFI